jgi:hypothetical protein
MNISADAKPERRYLFGIYGAAFTFGGINNYSGYG